MGGICCVRTARTDDVVLYTEFCKKETPTLPAQEIQKQLVANDVVLQENVPSQASISRTLTNDLGYSYKKARNIPKESLTDDAQRKLEECLYIAVCSTCDATKLYFFDECSKRREIDHTAMLPSVKFLVKFSVMRPMRRLR